MSEFFEKSNVGKNVIYQEPEMEITILSDVTKNYFLTVTASQLEEAVKYFSEIDDDEVFEGKGRRALLEHYENTLPETCKNFAGMRWGELIKSEEFGIFSSAVLDYEVLKYVEYGDPIMLAILRHERNLIRH